MRGLKTAILAVLVGVAGGAATPADAAAQSTYDVTCRSEEYRYETCALRTAGWVEMSRQISRSACIKGRTWDYNRREIWVDDGCGAEFRVHTYGSDDDEGGSGNAAAAAGVLVGAAILGAILNNDDHDDDHKYQDKNWQGSRHSSYVPVWMVGTFRGYNPQYGEQVDLTVSADGRAVARTRDGRAINGWINNEELHVGRSVFDVDRTHDGFVTHPVGNRYGKQLHYRRVASSATGGGQDSRASGAMPCSYGRPSYDRSCQFTVTRHGSGTFATATIHVEVPNGTWRNLNFERGEGTGAPNFYSPGANVQFQQSGDTWLINVNDREFFRFPEAVITGG